MCSRGETQNTSPPVPAPTHHVTYEKHPIAIHGNTGRIEKLGCSLWPGSACVCACVMCVLGRRAGRTAASLSSARVSHPFVTPPVAGAGIPETVLQKSAWLVGPGSLWKSAARGEEVAVKEWHSVESWREVKAYKRGPRCEQSSHFWWSPSAYHRASPQSPWGG